MALLGVSLPAGAVPGVVPGDSPQPPVHHSNVNACFHWETPTPVALPDAFLHSAGSACALVPPPNQPAELPLDTAGTLRPTDPLTQTLHTSWGRDLAQGPVWRGSPPSTADPGTLRP